MTERTWLITGISSGLGRTMAEELLARSERVAGTYRKGGSLAELKARFGDRLCLAELDVTDTAAMREVVTAAFRSRPYRRRRQRCRLRRSRCGGRVERRRDLPADRHQPHRLDPVRSCRDTVSARSGRRPDHSDLDHGWPCYLPGR